MGQPLVYLCGPITGCSYGGAVDWREGVKKELAKHCIRALSPMRGKHYLLKENAIGDCYDETILSSQKAITTRDRFDTMRADMLLVNLLGAQRVSIGSMIELGWADAKRIPIVIAMEEGNLHNHAMVREIAGYRFVPTLDEAIMVVKSVLLD